MSEMSQEEVEKLNKAAKLTCEFETTSQVGEEV